MRLAPLCLGGLAAALSLAPPGARAGGNDTCIVAYEHAGFAGKASTFCSGGEPLANDSYSSLRVPHGRRVRVWEHGDRSGLARTYFQDVPFVGGLVNDRISYLEWGDFDVGDFAMLTSSDPQFSWDHCSDDPKSSLCKQEKAFFGPASAEAIGRFYNANLVGALNDVGEYFGASRLAGAIVNGDLTEFGDQGPDLGDYIDLYEHGLDMNVYLGLGNHDYANNVDDCAQNTCASSMLWYLRDQVGTLNPDAFDYVESGVYYEFPSLRKRHEGSLGYSWDVGDVHFVQLNNYPAYTRKWSGWNFGASRRDHFDVRSAMAWLRGDLQAARAAGKHIVLNLHDWGAVRDDAQMNAILQDFPVSAIFAGHWHGTYGEWEQKGPYSDGRRVPVLLSGSAHFGTFLVTRYLGVRMYVWLLQVDQLGGAKLRVHHDGAFHDAGNLDDVFRVCDGCPRQYDYSYDLR